MTPEDIQFHSIENQGRVPHNPEYSVIEGLIEESQEVIGILTIKPGFFPTDSRGVEIQRLLEGIITSSGLSVLCTSNKQLNADETRKLYATIFTDRSEGTPDWLTEIRIEILEFMTSGDSFSYFVTGIDAVAKTLMIKKLFRNSFAETGSEKAVRNGIHSSDPDDVRFDLNILFNNDNNEA